MSVTITAAMVNDLRKRTDLPMMECKTALQEANGDTQKAIEILRERFAKVAFKRAALETAEGRAITFFDNEKKIAAILDIRCESAPVTKSEHFIALAKDVVHHIAVQNPKTIEELMSQPLLNQGNKTVQDRFNEVIGLIRENMKVHAFQRLSGSQYGEYVHHDGSFAVLLEVNGTISKQEVLRDISAHIGAMNPQYMTRDQVPADEVQKQSEILRSSIAEDPKTKGKPANILEKILEGQLRDWLSERVLLEQEISNQSKYPGKKISDLLLEQKLTLVSFIRIKIGEVSLG